MDFIKSFFAHYSAWLKGVLLQFGPWGVFFIGAIDATVPLVPLDPVMVAYVYAQPHLCWLYILLGSAGSALGNMVLYGIGYRGGEALLEKRIAKAKFEKIKKSFEDHEFLALMFPAMLPPPTPFKAIVLTAAAFEMDWHKFLFAIFLGRLARFTILSVLVIVFGPRVIDVSKSLLRQHLGLTLAFIAVVIFLGFLFWSMRKRRASRSVQV